MTWFLREKLLFRSTKNSKVLREIYRIELPTVFGMKTVNSFVILNDEMVLIDCGEDTDASFLALEAGMRHHGLYIKDIDRIIITHAHVDHMGMASRVAEEADAEVWVSELVLPWAIDPKEMWIKRKSILGPEMMKYFPNEIKSFVETNYLSFLDSMSDVWQPIPEKRIKTFDSEGMMRIASEMWNVIYLPGHSQSQSAFYNQKTKELLSADMLLRITPTPVIEADIKDPSKRSIGIIDLLDSYKKIRSLDIQTVYPGHYEIFHNAHEVIDRQVNRIHDRKEKCLEYIETGISKFYDLLQAMYSSNFSPPAMIMLIGYLDLLQAEGKIRMQSVDSHYEVFPS